MVNHINKYSLLVVTLATLFSQSIAHAATLGGASTAWQPAYSWTFSYENMLFTRANITLDVNGETVIIAAPTFDITEDSDTFSSTTSAGITTTTGKGSALFKGTVKVEHGPASEAGKAWAELQMKWPEIDIEIISTPVTAERLDELGNIVAFTFYKESRVYSVTLNSSSDTNTNTNTDKLTNGFKRIVPELPHTGVYAICDGINDSFLCQQEIGYGTFPFNPTDIFQTMTSASGQEILPNTGFYWDEICVAFDPEDLKVNLAGGQDFKLKQDSSDGLFRSCEGRSVAFNACTNPGLVDELGNPTGFNCNDTNEGKPFTFVLANAAAGDRLEPTPESICIGTNVEDWLALSAHSGSGEDLLITPCDINQGYMRLPYGFSDTSIAFTSSEGDNAVINDLQITGIVTSVGKTLVLQESPDKTDSVWDFSNIQMDNISSISSLELNDTVTGTAGTDVLLGGNGTDSLHGFSGGDCIDGGQNDDNLWGDGHADSTANQGDRGADVFVLTSKLGKDTIHDFSVADGDNAEGDKIVNVSGTPAEVSPNTDGTYTVALKGQNYVIVTSDGALVKGVNVIDAQNLSDYGVCKGYPLF